MTAAPAVGPARSRTVRGVVLAVAEITVLTAVIAVLGQVVSVHALAALYVLAILPIAIWWGFGWAMVVAVASTVTFNFFFVAPLFVLTPSDADTVAVLLISVVTAFVVSELAGRVQRRAREAEQLAREVRRNAQEQSALRRVATLVAHGAAPADTFGSVATEVGRLFGADVVVVLRFEPERTATVVGRWCVPGVAFSDSARLQVEGAGAGVTVLETGHPARTERFEGPSGSVAGCIAELGSRSGVEAPISVEGRLWGAVIAAATAREKLPVGSEVDIAGFTGLAATAIANAQARVELREFADEQAALRRVATLVARAAPPEEVFALVSEEVGRLLDVDSTIMSRYDPDGAATVLGRWSRTDTRRVDPVGDRIPPGGHNVHTLVLRTHRPARIDDYAGAGAEAVRNREAGAAVGVPISVEDRLWGVMIVLTQDRSLPPDTETRLAGFTELVATAIANAEAQAQLTASRARIVAAADQARRRIERDLHDGAQQRLVSLALRLRSAQEAVPPDAGRLKAQLDDMRTELIEALDELRETAHGIHPAVLANGGLRPALKALARRSAVPVRLDVGVDGRLPEQVDTGAYHVVSEALTNATKHAHASLVDVEVDHDEDVLRIQVRDDGRGGADPGRGSGLVGLRDRVEALGGRLVVRTAPGAGTTVHAELPLAPARAGSG